MWINATHKINTICVCTYLCKLIQVGVNLVLKFYILWKTIVSGRSTPILHHPWFITGYRYVIMMIVLLKEEGKEGEERGERERERERERYEELCEVTHNYSYMYLHEGDRWGVQFVKTRNFFILPSTIINVNNWVVLFTAAEWHKYAQLQVQVQLHVHTHGCYPANFNSGLKHVTLIIRTPPGTENFPVFA